MEAGFQPLIRGRPELLAHHLTESREIERATALWLEAGRRAIERSANAEAIAHLTTGLELLDKVPDKADCSGRVLWDAEFDRLRGEMLLTFDEGNQAEAEASEGLAHARNLAGGPATR